MKKNCFIRFNLKHRKKNRECVCALRSKWNKIHHEQQQKISIIGMSIARQTKGVFDLPKKKI